MTDVIVFLNKAKMEKFIAENKIPEGVTLDHHTETGELAGIEKHREEFPDFYCIDGFQRACGLIYHAMHEDWRRDYSDKGKIDGCYIAMIRGDEVGTLMNHLKMINGGGGLSKWTPSKVWYPPNFAQIDGIRIVELKPEKENPPIIDRLLGRGESLLISGTAGIGKSLMVNYLAYILANSDSLWQEFRIPGPVTSLIVQSELNGFAQRDRIQKLLKAHPGFTGEKVYMVTKPYDLSECQVSGRLDDVHFQEDIVSMVYQTKAKVLFLDPLISFNPANENDNTQMRRVLDSFMDAIKNTGVSVVITHHMTKEGKKTRGASAIRDWAANALELELERLENGEALIKVTHDKARNFEQVDPFYITRTRDLSFELAESKATRKEDERLKCVVDALTSAGGRIEGQKQFADLISENALGVKNRTARDRIRDARDCGLILEIDQGHKVPKVYLFPEK